MARRPKTRVSKVKGTAATRRAAQARSDAARKGWATRRALARARSLAAKKGWRTRRAVKGRKVGRPSKRDVMYLVTVAIDYGEGRPRKRDLLIPGPEGATFRELKAIAEDTLPPRAQPLLLFMTKKNTTIALGPKTRAQKATDR